MVSSIAISFFVFLALSFADDSSETEITNDLTLSNCADFNSCTGTYTDVSKAYCNGWKACAGADISTVRGSGGIFLYGGVAASLSTLTTAEAVYAWGYWAAFKANILAKQVYASGYQALRQASLYANPGTRSTYIVADGYFAMMNANLQCFSGETCTVVCESQHGCTRFSMYCLEAAVCDVTCEWGAMHCPTVYDSNTLGSDEDIIERREYDLAMIELEAEAQLQEFLDEEDYNDLVDDVLNEDAENNNENEDVDVADVEEPIDEEFESSAEQSQNATIVVLTLPIIIFIIAAAIAIIAGVIYCYFFGCQRLHKRKRENEYQTLLMTSTQNEQL